MTDRAKEAYSAEQVKAMRKGQRGVFTSGVVFNPCDPDRWLATLDREVQAAHAAGLEAAAGVCDVEALKWNAATHPMSSHRADGEVVAEECAKQIRALAAKIGAQP